MAHPEKYRATLFRDKEKIEVVDLPWPECGDDDIIVKNLMAGVCGGDLGAYRFGGDDNRVWKDHEFGHEMVSEVVEIGKNVTGLKLGDHVFPNMGKAKRDPNRVATVGGFSEYIHIPQCEVGYSVMMVPNDIPLKAAALTEPFVIAARGANSQFPEPGQSVTVFGAGTIGIAAAIMLKWYGAGKILIVDVSEKRLKVAEQFGLITCNSATEDLKAKAIETFGSSRGLAGEVSDCELYVDCVGMQPILDNFQQLAKPCAKLTVVGVYHAPATINMMWVCYSTWNIRGCGTKSLEELFPDVIAMMQSGKFDISSLISHEYSIEDVDDAFQKAFDSQEALKVAISYV